MKLNQFLIVLFVGILAIPAFSQRNFAEMADRDFADQKYSIAIDKYKKAYSKTKDRDEKNRIRFQMAESYRMMNNSKRDEN